MSIAADPRQSLRRTMRQRRATLSARERMKASQMVAEHVLSMVELQTPCVVAVYWAMRSELPLLHAVSALQRVGHQLCLPMVQADFTLRFGAWRPGDAVKANQFGIPEPDIDVRNVFAPQQLDVILVPLLAFDTAGGRIGSGAGFYDRSFAFLSQRARPSRPLLVGVGYALQQVAALPVAEWDVPLDAVVTEDELIRCSSLRLPEPGSS